MDLYGSVRMNISVRRQATTWQVGHIKELGTIGEFLRKIKLPSNSGLGRA